MPCGEKHVEILTGAPLPFFHQGKHRIYISLQAQHTLTSPFWLCHLSAPQDEPEQKPGCWAVLPRRVFPRRSGVTPRVLSLCARQPQNAPAVPLSLATDPPSPKEIWVEVQWEQRLSWQTW